MKLTIINTGGTFNKIYNPLSGELDVPTHSHALNALLEVMYNVEVELITTLSKDSLDMTQEDRQLLVETIKNCPNDHIIIIHGTDTMYLTAEYIAQHISNKKIVLTGAMIPMSIDGIEATLNFSMALGFLNATIANDVYIAMHGVVVPHQNITKNKEEGKFLCKSC